MSSRRCDVGSMAAPHLASLARLAGQEHGRNVWVALVGEHGNAFATSYQAVCGTKSEKATPTLLPWRHRTLPCMRRFFAGM